MSNFFICTSTQNNIYCLLLRNEWRITILIDYKGSYSDSAGIEIIRKHAAAYISKRDGFPSNPDDVILCAGASEGIRV